MTRLETIPHTSRDLCVFLSPLSERIKEEDEILPFILGGIEAGLQRS
jgi:hypothetical protein